MYIKNNNNNIYSPYLIRNISFEDKLFLNTDFCNATISPLKMENATGNSSEINKTDTLMACFGEYNERLSMFYNISPEIHMLSAFSLFDDEILKINPSEIYLNYGLKGLSMYKKNFSDSCGVASHVNSDSALYAAILEFVERQSLILTWLAKKVGTKYSIDLLMSIYKKGHIIKKFSKIFSYFKIYNISIYSGIFVILIIGANNKAFSIGLNAGLTFTEALDGALNEFHQSYESILLYQNNPNNNEKELYKKKFLSQTAKEFIQNYNFLEKSISGEISLDDELQGKGNNYDLKFLKKLIFKVPIKYYAVSIPPIDKKTRLRIVKVFSTDAFPHMNTKIIDPNKYKITAILGFHKFPNKGNIIPFP